ncbi:MAG: hypothetical protein D6714_16940, partial [Bacteroidetes bacterium]
KDLIKLKFGAKPSKIPYSGSNPKSKYKIQTDMKISLFFSILFISFTTFAQQAHPTPILPNIDSRLFEVFEADYLRRVQHQNPILIQRWNFYLDHAWYITDLPASKNAGLPVVQIDDPDAINILALRKEQNLVSYKSRMSIYRIAGTDKALVILPADVFNQKLNAFLGRE